MRRFCDWRRITAEDELIGVELLRQNLPPPHQEQVSGSGVFSLRVGAQQKAGLRIVERAEPDAAIIRVCGLGKEDEMAAIRQEIGVVMPGLKTRRVETGDWRRRPA